MMTLTLRDLFASFVMAGLLAGPDGPSLLRANTHTKLADRAYEIADAMLKVRRP